MRKFRKNSGTKLIPPFSFIEFIKSLLLSPFILHARPKSTRPTSTSLSAADAPSYLREKLGELPGSARASVIKDSEGGVLKRTLTEGTLGHLEQADPDLNIKRYCEILECIEGLILDHILHQNTDLPELSRLRQLVPTIGRFFTTLPLRESFLQLNKRRSISSRRFVPPSFNDIRHLLNAAQVTAIAPTLKLITFDGDMTLYADGADFAADSVLVGLLVALLRLDIYVAIVTAAGYAGDAPRYEKRLSGLLEGIARSDLTPKQKGGFYVLGGECNYLFHYDPTTDHLVYMKEETYQPADVRKWSTNTEQIRAILDVGETCMEEVAEEMGLTDRISILRKERAVGVIQPPGSTERLSREQLDEFVLAAQRRLNNFQHAQRIKRRKVSHSGGLRSSSSREVLLDDDDVQDAVPFCVFNGGSDAWVDIGNKLIGVKILQDYLKTAGHETLHVGDQFLSTGNDILTRSCACTTWITSPEETAEVLKQLHEHFGKIKRVPK
ncbi:IMP 5'-nucleotidase [Phlyctochytrium planicorne]|nr:IMP 5'-nucleotidase [Phlyctochytrium planicorne]